MKNVDFFQNLFLVEFVKNKGLIVTEGHNLTFLKEKSTNPANLSKNDLTEVFLKGGIRKYPPHD